MKERYMVLGTDEEIRWIETEHENRIQAFKEAISCEWLENVRTIIPDVCMIVDEMGKVKANPQTPQSALCPRSFPIWPSHAKS